MRPRRCPASCSKNEQHHLAQRSKKTDGKVKKDAPFPCCVRPQTTRGRGRGRRSGRDGERRGSAVREKGTCGACPRSVWFGSSANWSGCALHRALVVRLWRGPTARGNPPLKRILRYSPRPDTSLSTAAIAAAHPGPLAARAANLSFRGLAGPLPSEMTTTGPLARWMMTCRPPCKKPQ